MIKIPGMLMVGAGNRNIGKTEFACSLIRKFRSRHNIVGIKVTTIHEKDSCPRGASGCGTCATLEGDFDITAETNSQSDKDTCRMLAAGAARVFWLKVLKTHLEEGISRLLDKTGGAVLVCESNSLRQVVEPGLFVMIKSRGGKSCKASAKEVAEYADMVIQFNGKGFDIDPDQIELINGRWANKMDATAIIMAGGQSMRMGRDKSMLLIDGKPVIEHIFNQLQPHFSRILISSDDLSKYSFLDARIIPDKATGMGPIMGIASTLKVSANDVNFVIACDIPEVDISLVRRMVRESAGFDAVVPRVGPEQYEPLFAVYKKSVLPAIDKAIASGNYRIIDPLKDCKVKYIDSACAGQLKNLNTMKDYHKFIGKKNNVAI